MTLTALLTLMGLQILIAISPGPAAVITIKTAAATGARDGLLISLGLSLAIILWAAAALAGLSVLFEIAPFLQTALRVLGGLFLIWIGVSMIRHARAPMVTADMTTETGVWRLLRLGLMTNLANPKALAYFAAVFVGIMPNDPTIAAAILILFVIFLIEFTWYAILSLVFSLPSPRRAYQRGKTYLDRIFGGLIAMLGARIAYN